MNTNINRTKPTKMQARGGGAHNQQNQNPNVGAIASSSTETTSSNDVKANLDSVLEISMDKRNVKSNRGGKRKRINLPGANQESQAITAAPSIQ